jgi:hypothetical protein
MTVVYYEERKKCRGGSASPAVVVVGSYREACGGYFIILGVPVIGLSRLCSIKKFLFLGSLLSFFIISFSS